jgi:hypothetical protein
VILLVGSLAPAARRRPLAEGALVTAAALLAWAGLAVVPALNARKGLKAFCSAVKPRAAAGLPAGERLTSAGASRFPCLVYYLGRERVVSRSGGAFLQGVAAAPRGTTGLAIAEYRDLEDWRAAGLDADILHEAGGRRRGRLVFFRWRAAGKVAVD